MLLKFDEYINLNEAKRNLEFNYFKDLMTKKLGFTYKLDTPDHKFFKVVKDKDGNDVLLKVMNHVKHKKGIVDPKAFQHMKDELVAEFQATGKTEQFDKVDWNLIGIPNPMKDPKSIVYQILQGIIDTSEFEIYQRVFPEKNTVCVIKNKNGEFNLCRNSNDLMPLLDRWYPLCQMSNELGKLCLGYTIEDLDSELFGDNLFEIKKDGTLGNVMNDDYVIESYDRSKL